MAVGGTQSQTGAEELGEADAGVGKRGVVCLYFGDVLCGSCTGSPVVWVVGVVYASAHWYYLGGIPPQGSPPNDGTATL